MSEWKATTIGEILDEFGGSVKTGPFGTALKASEYSKEGVPLISVREVGYGHLLIDESTPRVSPTVTQRLPEYLLRENDIVFGRKGAIDRSALVKREQDGWFLGSDGIRLRLPKEVETKYISFILRSEMIRSWLFQHSTGTTMASLNQGTISRIPLLIPPLPTQKAIAHILGTLDDKIELLRQMNETLETMARALFKSWFVDFDPVRKKADGLPTGLPNEIEDLFPNGFEDSELGEIPKGWKIGKLGDDFKITMGQSPSGDTYNEVGSGMPFYQGRTDFGFRFPKIRIYCTDPKRIAEKGDTLISVRAPVGDQNIAFDKCCIGRGVGALRHYSNSISYTYYRVYFLQDALHSYNGEGTVFGSINQDSLKGIKQVIPPIELINKFELFSSSFDSKILVQDNQINNLILIRDSLLPKLISGDLELSEEGISKILEPAK